MRVTAHITPEDAEIVAVGPQRVETAAKSVMETSPPTDRSNAVALSSTDNLHLITGLTWEVATTPETPVIQKHAPPVLRLPTRRAVLPEAPVLIAPYSRPGADPDIRPDTGPDANPDTRPESNPATALLLAMAAELLTADGPGPASGTLTSGTWAFLAEVPPGTGVVWLALADLDPTADAASRVTPRPGPEQIFDTPEAALAAVQDHLDITDLAGLAVTWSTGHSAHRKILTSGLSRVAPGLPLEELRRAGDTETGPAHTDPGGQALPVFAPPRRVPLAPLGGAVAGLGLLLAGVFGIAPLIEARLTPPPPPPPQMVEVALAPGAFADACTAALAAWWPRVVGWQVESTGCALPRYVPQAPVLTVPAPGAGAAPTVPLLVWRHLRPERGRNRVLAETAAARVIPTWSHKPASWARMDSDTLTFWTTIALPLVARTHEPTAPSDPPESRATRLAALWADTPGVVTDDNGQVTIATGTTPPAVLFTRRVPGLAPVRLVQTAEGGTLLLAPPRGRHVPADLLPPDPQTTKDVP